GADRGPRAAPDAERRRRRDDRRRLHGDPPVRCGDGQGFPQGRRRPTGGDAVMSERRIDCHAHIIDRRRFPLDDGPGYKPRPDEDGPAELYRTVLERNGVQHALLVQPSGYGTDNAAMLVAIRGDRRRFKGIAMVEPDWDDG